MATRKAVIPPHSEPKHVSLPHLELRQKNSQVVRHLIETQRPIEIDGASVDGLGPYIKKLSI